MLVSLSVHDVVLIDRLALPCQPGLGVLTGETGAGKSILLDSLGLALGARSEAGLVRKGATQASVTAEFAIPHDHPAWAIAAEQGLNTDDSNLVLRRVVSLDGKSRAFLNDQPIGVTLLRRIGDELVEIHGQFDSHGLLDRETHASTLDSFGKLVGLRRETAAAYHAWREARTEREAAAGTVAVLMTWMQG